MNTPCDFTRQRSGPVSVYVLYIAMIRCSATHGDSTFPMVTSLELARLRHFTPFADAIRSELGDGEMVHRRDIEPAFLKIAAEVYRAISMRAQAAATNPNPKVREKAAQ